MVVRAETVKVAVHRTRVIRHRMSLRLGLKAGWLWHVEWGEQVDPFAAEVPSCTQPGRWLHGEKVKTS
jgi:hypothetical protein